MNEKARKYIDLFRQVKICTFATTDEKGRPRARIANIMIAADEGMYIVTSKGKPLYDQLIRSGEIALSAMCPDCQSLKFYGKVRLADKKWVDEVFVQNPGLNEVYPGDTRYILDAFLIYEGSGEWFDLLHHPINRETFSYGCEEEKVEYVISDACIKCDSCLSVCPQQCIITEEDYRIETEHCLQCGACREICQAGAIRRDLWNW